MSTEHQETTTPRLAWFTRFRAQKPAAGTTETPSGSEEGVLQVEKIDLKFAENGKLHNTWEYDLMLRPEEKERQLVIRRGKEFSIDLSFDRSYTKGSYDIKLIFALEGVKHKPGKGLLYNDATFVTVPLAEEKVEESSTGWFAHIANIQESQVTVELKAPPRCAIGKWNVQVEIKQSRGEAFKTHALPKPLIVIFNPWCPEDDTYMPADEDRFEYVLNSTGAIFRNDHHRPSAGSWNYSQFDSEILDCALLLLSHNCPSKKTMKPYQRGCGVPIVRLLAAGLNYDRGSQYGVLVGNWSGNFAGGKNPDYWTGSRDILQEYYRTRKPVRYGQCWVFAGLMTTICRALGIPCRPVTNYLSAHEKEEYSLALDRYVDKNGMEVDVGQDREWNFHVWSEVWLEREDVGVEYSGWQAVDTTPQELSGSTLRMGPAPVEACKRGEIKVLYDVDFLFSEVNSDMVTWRWMGEGQQPKLMSVSSSKRIGQKISTKAKNSLFGREDITLNYKYEEGTPEERDAFFKAVKLTNCCHGRAYIEEVVHEVKFELEIPETMIGQPFKMNVIVKNDNATEQREGQGKVRIESMNHAGRIIGHITVETFEFKVGPNSEERCPITVDFNKYKKFEGTLGIFCDASVNNTDIDYSEKTYFCFSKPELTFKLPKQTIRVDEDFDGMAFIHNPLPIPLKGYFLIDGSGITKKSITKRLKEPIKAGETGSVNFELRPFKAGNRVITAKFYSVCCPALYDVDGCVEIYVSPSENNIMPS